LRNKVNEQEIANDNLKRELDRTATQLKHANDRLAEEDKRIILLTQEVQRLGEALTDKAHEVDSWRDRCADTERRAQLDLERLREELDAQRRNEIVSNPRVFITL